MGNGGFWVFGYGSLIWKPGFEYEASELATLHGFHRSFCMRSIHYRGSREAPGLVLALDALAGATCRGVAYRVGASMARETLDYLRKRELISAAYLETRQSLILDSGSRVEAVCYVIDTGHSQYAGQLSLEEQARVISCSAGQNGRNDEYLFKTADSLERLGIADAELRQLSALVRAAS